MRRAEEQKQWHELNARVRNTVIGKVTLPSGDVDIRGACTVLGGLNGAGKSRLLRELRDHLGKKAIYIDLHRLCEEIQMLYRSRDDLNKLLEESAAVALDGIEREDVQRVIRRSYDAVEWFGLDINPSDEALAERLQWGSDTPTLPYFRVTHEALTYGAQDMGLGEFSAHLLFWILSQYRETGLFLILDEPDAYLPPIGVEILLDRLLRACISKGWCVVISTHSSEIISKAVENDSFLRLVATGSSKVDISYSSNNASVADELLGEPPIELVYLVEDESALALANALIALSPRQLNRSSLGIWGNGSGYLKKLQKDLPRPPKSPLTIALLFDGDQRKQVEDSRSNRWPALFLPTDIDPDSLFKTAGRGSTSRLSELLNVDVDVLRRFLDGRDADDEHDWVNAMGEKFGRPQVLAALSSLWVEVNNTDAMAWNLEFRTSLGLEGV